MDLNSFKEIEDFEVAVHSASNEQVLSLLTLWHHALLISVFIANDGV